MDCERIVSGMIGQPTNALSSLVFVAAAVWILALAFRGERAGRAALIVFALAVAANAVGSFALHGPNPAWAQWAHDAAIMSVLLFMGIRALGRARGWRASFEMAVYAAALVGVGVCLASIHGASDPFAGTLAAGAVVGEVATISDVRRTPAPTRLRSGALARGLGLAAIALGGVAFILGRSGSPLCRPESLFQWHALWHVLAAVALVAYVYAIRSRPAQRGERIHA